MSSSEATATTCQAFSASVGAKAGERCGKPAAFVAGSGAGYCYSDAAEFMRRRGSTDGYKPVTAEAREFMETFAANGYGPMGHVWPDASEGDVDEADEAEEEDDLG